MKTFIILSFLTLTTIVSAQQKYHIMKFDLIYFKNEDQLTKNQREIIEDYSKFLSNQITGKVFIDISKSKAGLDLGRKRYENLKSLFIQKLNLSGTQIECIEVGNYNYALLNEISGDFDALKIMVTYYTNSSNKAEVRKTSEKEMYEEKGVTSTSSRVVNPCDKDTIIEFVEGVKLKLNLCDYKMYKSKFTFTVQDGYELKSIPLPIDIKTEKAVLQLYNIRFDQNKSLGFPAELIVSKPSCIEKYELSPYKVDGKSTFVPLNNLYDRQDNDVVRFNIANQGGLYVMCYNKQGKEKSINFHFPSGYKVDYAYLSTNCGELHYSIKPTIDKKSFKASFFSFDYEPSITARVTDQEGNQYVIYNKKISTFQGIGDESEVLEFTQVNESNAAYSKNIFSAYKIKKADFKPKNKT